MSILVHLTDPNMNDAFQDRFFQGVDFPLDKVIMVFSYNDSSLVDPILLDRFKEIKVKPYTITDKVKIMQQLYHPRDPDDAVAFPPTPSRSRNRTSNTSLRHYTHEAGVRGIKRMVEQFGDEAEHRPPVWQKPVPQERLSVQALQK